MNLDGLGWSLIIFRNHHFLKIFQNFSLASPGGECFAPPPSLRGSAQSISASCNQMVRSTLHGVLGGRHNGNLKWCETIFSVFLSRAKVMSLDGAKHSPWCLRGASEWKPEVLRASGFRHGFLNSHDIE